MGAARRMLRYLVAIINHGIMYECLKEIGLAGYSNSDWCVCVCVLEGGGCVENQKSTSSIVFFLELGVVT